MQHIWEYLAIPKPTQKNVSPEPINRYVVTESNRRKKATLKMYEALEKEFKLTEKDLDNFLIRQHR